MMDKGRLHRLVDELPESEVPAAERYLEYLRLAGQDPVLHAILTAPEDDEPETAEERLAVDEAREDIRAGRVLDLDQVKRELGI
jgi:hypothetical protein